MPQLIQCGAIQNNDPSAGAAPEEKIVSIKDGQPLKRAGLRMCTSRVCQAHNHRAGIAEVATQFGIRSAYHGLAVRDQRCRRGK
jgi:hypothetical protein